jgi:hypothetical protein
MNDLFNPNNDSSSIINENNGRFSIRKSSFGKIINKTKRDLTFDEILNENGGLPKKSEMLLIKSNGCSDTGAIFESISKTGIVDEMYLSTWIISRLNIDYLCNQVDSGKIRKLIFVISVRQKQLKKSDYAHMIEEFKKRPEIKIRVCNCHAKTFSAKVGDNYYTVSGSGNWTKNPRIENYIVMNQREPFEHNKEWMEEMING